MRLHHDARMRTTIDLPPDLHRAALGIAHATRRSLSQTVADIMRRGLAADLLPREAQAIETDPLTGFPLVRAARPITPEDVKALDDEA